MRAPEKRFNLKFNEIFASSGTPLTLTKFFHHSYNFGHNIARVEVTEIFNISPAIHLTAYPEPQNVNNYTIFDGMPRYRVNFF